MRRVFGRNRLENTETKAKNRADTGKKEVFCENRKQEKIYCSIDDDPMYNYAVSTENIGNRGRFTARDSARRLL